MGSMIWVRESLGNYRWGVQLGLALCEEYNAGRGRSAKRAEAHKTQAVLEWLRDHEPKFAKLNRTPVQKKHLAMPDELKEASSSVEAYRDYYFSKRDAMRIEWPVGRTPSWWAEREDAARGGKPPQRTPKRPETKPPRAGRRRAPLGEAPRSSEAKRKRPPTHLGAAQGPAKFRQLLRPSVAEGAISL